MRMRLKLRLSKYKREGSNLREPTLEKRWKSRPERDERDEFVFVRFENGVPPR